MHPFVVALALFVFALGLYTIYHKYQQNKRWYDSAAFQEHRWIPRHELRQNLRYYGQAIPDPNQQKPRLTPLRLTKQPVMSKKEKHLSRNGREVPKAPEHKFYGPFPATETEFRPHRDHLQDRLRTRTFGKAPADFDDSDFMDFSRPARYENKRFFEKPREFHTEARYFGIGRKLDNYERVAQYPIVKKSPLDFRGIPLTESVNISSENEPEYNRLLRNYNQHQEINQLQVIDPMLGIDNVQFQQNQQLILPANPQQQQLNEIPIINQLHNAPFFEEIKEEFDQPDRNDNGDNGMSMEQLQLAQNLHFEPDLQEIQPHIEDNQSLNQQLQEQEPPREPMIEEEPRILSLQQNPNLLPPVDPSVPREQRAAAYFENLPDEFKQKYKDTHINNTAEPQRKLIKVSEQTEILKIQTSKRKESNNDELDLSSASEASSQDKKPSSPKYQIGQKMFIRLKKPQFQENSINQSQIILNHKKAAENLDSKGPVYKPRPSTIMSSKKCNDKSKEGFKLVRKSKDMQSDPLLQNLSCEDQLVKNSTDIKQSQVPEAAQKRNLKSGVRRLVDRPIREEQSAIHKLEKKEGKDSNIIKGPWGRATSSLVSKAAFARTEEKPINNNFEEYRPRAVIEEEKEMRIERLGDRGHGLKEIKEEEKFELFPRQSGQKIHQENPRTSNYYEYSRQELPHIKGGMIWNSRLSFGQRNSLNDQQIAQREQNKPNQPKVSYEKKGAFTLVSTNAARAYNDAERSCFDNRLSKPHANTVHKIDERKVRSKKSLLEEIRALNTANDTDTTATSLHQEAGGVKKVKRLGKIAFNQADYSDDSVSVSGEYTQASRQVFPNLKSGNDDSFFAQLSNNCNSGSLHWKS